MTQAPPARGSRPQLRDSGGRRGPLRRRRGSAAVDYVLILGVILPMAAFILRIGPRIIRAAYEMVMVLVSWPFM